MSEEGRTRCEVSEVGLVDHVDDGKVMSTALGRCEACLGRARSGRKAEG